MEAILILAIFTSIGLLVVRTAKSGRWAAAVVEGPWKPLRGMIEDGVWIEAGKSKALHPSIKVRHHSYRGEDVPPN